MTQVPPPGGSGTPPSLQEWLRENGVTTVAGFATNASNLVHAKTMPVERLASFIDSGAGMSPVYNGYSIDATIQFTPYISAVGDLRLRLDPSGVRLLGDGLALGPTDAYDQDGTLDPAGPRAVLRQVVSRLTDHGLSAQVGHELEFVLVQPDGSPIAPGAWTPYGLSAVLDRSAFTTDLLAAATAAGLDIMQFHAEFGPHQFEVSLAPQEPIAAADSVVIAKAVIGRVARRHDLAASFSPVPFPGVVGSGAHQHFSLLRDDANLFALGDGPRGITDEGGHAIAGVIAALPQIQAALTGSVISGARVAPGLWSGAFACWGTENREAAVRFLAGGPANPSGANVEVKIVDPSANPYLASAAILGAAWDGIRAERSLPDEVTVVPGSMTDLEQAQAGIRTLSGDQIAVLDAWDGSELVRELLGDPITAALSAVRRHEHEVYGGLDPEVLATRLRLAWTI